MIFSAGPQGVLRSPWVVRLAAAPRGGGAGEGIYVPFKPESCSLGGRTPDGRRGPAGRDVADVGRDLAPVLACLAGPVRDHLVLLGR